ncbi:unnamed protein product [Bursaphelenchus okinawaensis]|uniref:glucuronosyltransferase n=1 Tax=Bursaphelenchus okinawaensis TaxID=465554 RepID=A0A811K4C8_9BILA|nr:unnamed protein product [Bursaphelenchus okinawaensis]CAG9090475.1 unnamed protein product [Bursaphelenchus okinawaensis]
MNLLLLFLFTFVVSNGSALKFLVYNPKFGGSHTLFMGKLADEIAGAGHDVVVVQTIIDGNITFAGHTNKKVRLIEVPVKTSIAAVGSKMKDMWTSEQTGDMGMMGRMFRDACLELYNNKDVIHELKGEHFDVGIGEWFDVCGLGLFKYVGIEKWITAFGSAVPLQFMSVLGVPPAVSFVPGLFMPSMGHGIVSRAKDIFGFVMGDKVVFPSFLGTTAEAYKVFAENLDYKDLIANSSFIWVNTDEYVDFPRPISHKYVNIGGFGMKKALSKINALEPKYQQIFQKAKKGVVYMSFGSVAQSAWMPREMKNNILEAFNEFPDVQFIWKYENETENIAAKYSNVHTGKWLPQREIISHEKALVFITHGGMNSITEATYAGIPMICIPLFGDQNRNAGMIKSKGSALILERDDLLKKDSIVKTLREFMEDKSYKQKAQELSKIIKNKPYSPEERIIKTAEFAAQYDVHEHLELAGRHMNIIQYYNIDVFFVALVLLNILIVVLLFVGLFVKNLIFGPSKREKTE